MTALIDRHPRVADLLALLAGCLYPLGFAPFGIRVLVPGALALLVLSAVDASVRRGAFRFYLFSIGMYGIGTSWIYVSIHEHGNASPLLAGVLVLAFVAAISILFWLTGYLYLRFVRPVRFGILLGFPLVWCLREWTYTWFLTGFPWLFAGTAFIETPMAGYVPVVGVMGASLVVALQATLVALALRNPSLRAALSYAVAIAVSVAGGWGLGAIEFARPTGDTVTVSAVQGNIDQHIKWRREMVGPIVSTYTGLTKAEWGRDLIVWPEASITLFHDSATGLLDRWNRMGEARGSTLVLGMPDRSRAGDFQNTAVAVGLGEGQYIKRRLVPFGEYVPLEGLLRGIIGFFDLPMSRNTSGPWEQAPVTAGDLTLSLSICYEVVYPELVRQTASSPDLLVTISNDTWFGNSIGPWQHLEMARARALENGRYMIRSTNSGITALIDDRGAVVDSLPQFEPGVLRGEARLLSGETPWHRYGHGPLLIAMLLALTGMLVTRLSHVSAQPIR